MSSLQTTLGVFCGLSAELFGSYANIQIKYSHVLEESKPLSQQLALTRRSRFYVAIFLYSLNTILNVIAYAFASLNVLAPTSSLTIVMNAILARIYFNEVLSKIGILASIIIMVGSTIAVLYGKNEALSLDLKQLEILFSKGYVLLFGIFHWFLIISSLLIGKILSKQFINETSIVFMEEQPMDDDTNIGVLLQTADKSESDASIFDMYTSDPNFEINVSSDDQNMNGFQLLWKMVNDSVLETFSWNRSFQHTFRAFCYAFSVGSLAAWVQLIGKAIGILLSVKYSMHMLCLFCIGF